MNFHGLLENWRTAWPGPASHALLLLTAAVCGFLVGLERQRHEKPAGLRTLMMVCVGSAAFTLVSFAFTSTTGDSGRVAAQIVTGIGFLGAGVILHGRRFISGMTTAAIIWVTAAIGITVGVGYGVAGLGLSLFVVVLLRAVALYEHRFVSDIRRLEVEVGFDPAAGRTRVRLERVLSDYHVPARDAAWDAERLRLRLHMARVPLYDMLGEMVDIPEVRAVAEKPLP